MQVDKNGTLLREFCAENLEHVVEALASGARRIELCDNLAVGGTTPSYGVIKAAVDLCHVHDAAVMCMIRPRGGDFEYSPEEASIMRDDLRMAASLGVDGVVFGCLRDGKLDRDLTAELVELAREVCPVAEERLQITFHMAFDALPVCDQLEALDWLADQGVDRVLTHGGQAGTSIADNLAYLGTLVDYAKERLIVLPGGGITWENAEQIAGELGVSEVHGTKIVKLN